MYLKACTLLTRTFSVTEDIGQRHLRDSSPVLQASIASLLRKLRASTWKKAQKDVCKAAGTLIDAGLPHDVRGKVGISSGGEASWHHLDHLHHL